jgi:hypothetical protein
VGTKLVVIGGVDDSRVYNDVYVLDTGAPAPPLPYLLHFFSSFLLLRVCVCVCGVCGV